MVITTSDLLSYFNTWVTVLMNVWEILNTHIGTLVAEEIGSGNILLAPIYGLLELTGLGSVTLLGAMIGGGLIFYIVYQLIIWFLNLIT